MEKEGENMQDELIIILRTKRESEINKNEYEAIPHIDYEDYFNNISKYISDIKIINYKIIDELKRIKMV